MAVGRVDLRDLQTAVSEDDAGRFDAELIAQQRRAQVPELVDVPGRDASACARTAYGPAVKPHSPGAAGAPRRRPGPNAQRRRSAGSVAGASSPQPSAKSSWSR